MWRTLKALQWIMFSERSLLVEDLIEACAIVPPLREQFDSEQQKILESLDLIDCLRGLVRIQPPLSEDEDMTLELRTHVVTMAHFSVNEYLHQLDTACFGIDASWFDKVFASSYLSQACFIYILEATSEAHSSTSKTMLEYADQSWPLHLATCIQATGRAQYAGEATNAALASKIRNLIEFPDLDMYDDCSSLRRHVQDIVQSYLDSNRCDELFGKLLRRTAHCGDGGLGNDSPERSIGNWQYAMTLYSPLEPGYFRFLVLHPAEKPEDTIRCSLVVDDLQNRARYAYLSYVWGTYKYPKYIYVDGEPLQITQGLSKALLGLRHNTNPAILWVDAICIDQADTMERSHQVSQMAEFVRYASFTLAWLPDECTNDAPQPKSLRNLYSQTFWHRRWVQQEIVLARDVSIQWGRVKMSWANIMLAVEEETLESEKEQLDQKTISAISYFSTLQELRVLLGEEHCSNQRLELQESLRPTKSLLRSEALLYALRSTLCSDSRDTLFAILPLMSIDEASRILVDYTLSTCHIMTNFAKMLLERSQGYHILSMVDSKGGAYNPPSWVPTWINMEDHPLAPGNAIPKQPKLYEASTKTPTFMVNEDALHVEGWLIGNIAHVAKISDIIRNDKMVEFERGLLVRVMLEDRCRDNPLRAFQRMTIQSRDWFTELPDASRLLSELESRGSRARRCIAKTASKLLANVPAYTAVGDVIAIFHGGEVPYVLRPGADWDWTLVGEW